MSQAAAALIATCWPVHRSQIGTTHSNQQAYMCLHCHLPHRTSLHCERHPLLGVHLNGSNACASGPAQQPCSVQQSPCMQLPDALELEPLTTLLATAMLLPATLSDPDLHHLPLLMPNKPPALHCATPVTHVLIHAHYTCATAISAHCSGVLHQLPANTDVCQLRCGHTGCLIRSLAHIQPLLRALLASAKDALACCCQV